ncbi:hypothetical protein QUB56_11820 [Microcoleus sp. AR_TQ3_B6]|uniref:hypothetical protein n=1 Tax=Microcoleus sp. AR_TQ3_B6 TaxID=3055284 RepID=UPI002FD44391
MMTERRLEQILARYQKSFTEKIYAEENEEHDILMDVLGISPIKKKKIGNIGRVRYVLAILSY